MVDPEVRLKPLKSLNNDEQRDLIEADVNNLTAYWKGRDDRMTLDRSLLNLEKKEAKQDESNWITNEPKVFFDTSRALVSIYPPKFRLPILTNPEEEQKDKMNKAERLAIGIFRQLDRDVSERGGVSWLWDLAFYVLLGWYAVFYNIEKSPDGLRFRADCWDPMTVYPEWDEYGLKRCVRHYETDELTAQSVAASLQKRGLKFDYKSPPEGNRAKITNWWLRTIGNEGKAHVWNAVVINGLIAKPITLQKQFKRIPIRIGAIGAPDRHTANWQARWGESILTAAKDMYEYRSKIMQLYIEIVAETAYPNIVTKTRTGQSPIKGELKGHGQEVSMRLEDQIDLLKHAAGPKEADLLLNFIGQRISEATLPPTVYGQIPYEISGFAVSQFMAVLKYKLGPYLNALQWITGGLMTDYLHLYRNSNFGDITLSTYNPSDVRTGMTFLEEFKKSDVPEQTFVEVTIPITSTFDRTQQILNMRQALQPPAIYSLQTMWEMDDVVQDFELERERMKQDMVEQDPFVLEMDLIASLWRRYEQLKEDNPIAAEALKQWIFKKEMTVGMRKGAPVQADKEGIRPELAPPETRGAPDMVGAMLGKQPPSPKRAGSEVETGQNVGRRGVLFRPSGEQLM